jgi:hypothetical protein
MNNMVRRYNIPVKYKLRSLEKWPLGLKEDYKKGKCDTVSIGAASIGTTKGEARAVDWGLGVFRYSVGNFQDFGIVSVLEIAWTKFTSCGPGRGGLVH